MSKLLMFFVALGFVGYAPVIADIIADHEISDTDDDQLYYTKIYLDETKRVRGSLQFYKLICNFMETWFLLVYYAYVCMCFSLGEISNETRPPFAYFSKFEWCLR